jgi:threonine dehydratase
MFGKLDIKGKKTACIVSGGNIDVNILSRVIARGLMRAGRNALLRIELTDRPGELALVSKVIAESGANVTGVHYNRSMQTKRITDCFLDVSVETRDYDHLALIHQAMRNAGLIVHEVI